jgi:hypothetical protein
VGSGGYDVRCSVECVTTVKNLGTVFAGSRGLSRVSITGQRRRMTTKANALNYLTTPSALNLHSNQLSCS